MASGGVDGGDSGYITLFVKSIYTPYVGGIQYAKSNFKEKCIEKQGYVSTVFDSSSRIYLVEPADVADVDLGNEAGLAIMKRMIFGGGNNGVAAAVPLASSLPAVDVGVVAGAHYLSVTGL